MKLFLCSVVIAFVSGFLTSYSVIRYYNKKNNDKIDRMQSNIDMLNQWLILKHSGCFLDKQLKEKDINSIAIYGMGINGRHLVREMENGVITISYGIDVKINKPYKNIPILKLNKEMETVDAVINTVNYDKQNIINKLCEYYTCPILNLDELIYEYHFEKIR